MCLYVLYKTCAGVNIDPMGQTFKKNIYITYTYDQAMVAEWVSALKIRCAI